MKIHEADGQKPWRTARLSQAKSRLQCDYMSNGYFICILAKNRFLGSFVISGHLITSSRAGNGP